MIVAFLLGRFLVQQDSVSMTEESFRSDMLIKLLTYMIMNRNHNMTVKELSGVLWDETEIENPVGALKNLMYRLRTKLREDLGDQEYIITGRGYYAWNSEIDVQVDAEQFEEIVKEAMNQKKECQILTLEKALSLYKGEFGVNCKENFWITTKRTYFHSMYISVIHALSALYEEKKQYDKLEALCQKALQIDLADEMIHCYLIQSLICQDKDELAKAHLEDARRILNDTIGIRNSKKLDELQNQIHQKYQTEMVSIEDVIKANPMNQAGAFQCNFSVFKQIYQLEIRRMERLGMAEYIGLFTILGEWQREALYEKLMSEYLITQALDRLEEVIRVSLRSGDVFTRVNNNQIFVLLPGCNYEASVRVFERIQNTYFQQFTKEGIRLKWDIHQVTEYEI